MGLLVSLGIPDFHDCVNHFSHHRSWDFRRQARVHVIVVCNFKQTELVFSLLIRFVS
jgi:hypothetical protein